MWNFIGVYTLSCSLFNWLKVQTLFYEQSSMVEKFFCEHNSIVRFKIPVNIDREGLGFWKKCQENCLCFITNEKRDETN